MLQILKNHLKGEYNHIYINKNNTPVSVLEISLNTSPAKTFTISTTHIPTQDL